MSGSGPTLKERRRAVRHDIEQLQESVRIRKALCNELEKKYNDAVLQLRETSTQLGEKEKEFEKLAPLSPLRKALMFEAGSDTGCRIHMYREARRRQALEYLIKQGWARYAGELTGGTQQAVLTAEGRIRLEEELE